MLGIEDYHHRFKLTQVLIFSPHLRKPNHRLKEISTLLRKYPLKHIKEIKRIGGTSRKPCEYLPLIQRTDLGSITFEDSIPKSHLSIPSNDRSTLAFVA